MAGSSATIEPLKSIVARCQRNEEHLRQLARQTRDERQRVEKLLRARRPKSAHRVRFNLQQEETPPVRPARRSTDDELDELARRCEKLLQRLNDEHRPGRTSNDVRNEILRLRLEQHDLIRRS